MPILHLSVRNLLGGQTDASGEREGAIMLTRRAYSVLRCPAYFHAVLVDCPAAIRARCGIFGDSRAGYVLALSEVRLGGCRFVAM